MRERGGVEDRRRGILEERVGDKLGVVGGSCVASWVAKAGELKALAAEKEEVVAVEEEKEGDLKS